MEYRKRYALSIEKEYIHSVVVDMLLYLADEGDKVLGKNKEYLEDIYYQYLAAINIGLYTPETNNFKEFERKFSVHDFTQTQNEENITYRIHKKFIDKSYGKSKFNFNDIIKYYLNIMYEGRLIFILGKGDSILRNVKKIKKLLKMIENMLDDKVVIESVEIKKLYSKIESKLSIRSTKYYGY